MTTTTYNQHILAGGQLFQLASGPDETSFSQLRAAIEGAQPASRLVAVHGNEPQAADRLHVLQGACPELIVEAVLEVVLRTVPTIYGPGAAYLRNVKLSEVPGWDSVEAWLTGLPVQLAHQAGPPTFKSVAAWLQLYGRSLAGQAALAKAPTADIGQCLLAGDHVYVSLPTMGKDHDAHLMGRLVLRRLAQDLLTNAGELSQASGPRLLIAVDDAAMYGDEINELLRIAALESGALFIS